MAILDISNLPINASFQSLLQVSSSEVGTAVGTVVTDLDVTASNATTAVTAATATTATTALTATTASYIAGANVDGIVASATSASHAIFADTAGGATDVNALYTASVVDSTISFLKGGGGTFPITVDNIANAISSSHAVNADTVGLFNKNTVDGAEFQVLRTDGAGNLSFDFADRTQIEVRALEAISKGDPLYVAGFSVGQNRVEVRKADASNPSQMPSFGLAYEDAALNTNTQMVSIGTLDNLNTLTGGLVSPSVGDTIYVNVGGGFTNVKPTGTNLIQNVGIIGRVNGSTGEVVASAIGRSNDLPNLAQGSVFVGGVNDVAAAVPTGSLLNNLFSGNNSYTGNNDFAGTQTFNNIAVNGTGSFAYIESITGSAKIIGDAFIVLNNNTPTERYAGVAVFDSGSIATTASFQFDGSTNDWFYEYSDDGGVTTDHGVAMFGPEYAAKGTPVYPTTNQILKGNGHHVEDSTISDNGTTVSVGSNLVATGSHILKNVTVTPETILNVADSVGTVLQVDNSALSGVTGFGVVANANTKVDGDFVSTGTSLLSGKTTLSSGLEVSGSNTIKNFSPAPSTILSIGDGTKNILQLENSALEAITGFGATFDGNVKIDGATTITGATTQTGKLTVAGSIEVTGSNIITNETVTPETILNVKDSSGTILQVDNSALSGVTGFGIVANSNTKVDGALTVTGTSTLSGLAYPTSDGTDGQVITTDGAGALAFESLTANTEIVNNSTDTYTGTAATQHIITLTQVEYDAIATPNVNTLYIII